MLLKYIICEDGDDQNHPNVFNIASSHASSSSQITLEQVRSSFPVPGQYHFRFLTNVHGNKVWMDVVDANANIPLFDNGIFAKVSRINPAASSSSTSSNQHQESRTINSSNNNNMNGTNNNRIHSNQGQQQGQQQKSSNNNISSSKLINFNSDDDGDSPVRNIPVIKPPSSGSLIDTDDLLGMNTPSPSDSASAGSKNTSSIDLFGLETLQPQAPSSMSNNGMKVNSFNGMMPQQNRNNNNNAFDPFGSLSNPSSFPRGPPAAQGKRF